MYQAHLRGILSGRSRSRPLIWGGLYVVRQLAFLTALTMALLSVATTSRAEGGSCPSGYYPVGGQGAQGCAPIPGGASGGSSSSQIRLSTPTGKWSMTWGSIAGSKQTQDAGVSTGLRTKAEAEQEAIRKCASAGAKDCEIAMTYHNQCVAWVIPSGSSGPGNSGLGSGPSEKAAIAGAQMTCKNNQPGKCSVFYTNCTKPIFDEF